MKNENDILNRDEFKQNPFTVPEGYFTAMEDSLREKVLGTKKQPSRAAGVLKPALMLAFSFAIIFGLAYGVFSLTNTLAGPEPQLSEYDAIAAEIGNINPAFFEYLDEFNIEDYQALFTPTDEDIMEYFATPSTDVTLYNYLASIE